MLAFWFDIGPPTSLKAYDHEGKNIRRCSTVSELGIPNIIFFFMLFRID